jgi:hypothetical protein
MTSQEAEHYAGPLKRPGFPHASVANLRDGLSGANAAKLAARLSGSHSLCFRRRHPHAVPGFQTAEEGQTRNVCRGDWGLSSPTFMLLYVCSCVGVACNMPNHVTFGTYLYSMNMIIHEISSSPERLAPSSPQPGVPVCTRYRSLRAFIFPDDRQRSPAPNLIPTTYRLLMLIEQFKVWPNWRHLCLMH